jgi:hypothetical protein
MPFSAFQMTNYCSVSQSKESSTLNMLFSEINDRKILKDPLYSSFIFLFMLSIKKNFQKLLYNWVLDEAGMVKPFSILIY